VSAKVAYLSVARLERVVPASVFWPRPKVDSALVSLRPRPAPIPTPRDRLFATIDRAFAERRKTISNAVRRMGLDPNAAAEVLERAEVDPMARAEDLSLEAIGRIADALPEDASTERRPR
jgi:16S rRNA (adenine1518-N6/adenine1519-N6)-dimethyltransferase